MSDIISIYLQLDCPTFIAALARDDRSYSATIFNKAARILGDRNLKSPDEIAKLYDLVRKVEEVRKTGAEEEEELGDVPDEFLGKEAALPFFWDIKLLFLFNLNYLLMVYLAFTYRPSVVQFDGGPCFVADLQHLD